MRLKGVLFMRRTITQMCMHKDEGWLFFLSLGSFDRSSDCLQVIPIFNGLRMPSISAEALFDVFRKGKIRGCGQGYMVVIIQIDEFAESQMSGKRSGFGGHSFHQIAVAGQAISI